MILFCDTSALVKLYIVEAGSDLVKRSAAQAETIAACRITWAEAHAAFARRVREVPKDAAALGQAKRAFAVDWPRYAVLDVDQALVEQAAEFADTFALRAYDSIQLAAAFETASVTQLPTVFACFDARLNKAAKVLGMSCLPEA